MTFGPLTPLILYAAISVRALARYIERLSVRAIGSAVLVAMAGTTILTLVNAPGLFWTWGTITLHLGTFLAIYAATGGARGLLIAVAGMGLIIAGWEAFYHLGYNAHHANGADMRAVAWQFGPMAAGSAMILWRVRPIVLTRPAMTLGIAAVLAGLLATWWATGFPVDVVWADGDLVRSTASTSDMVLQKGAKIAVACLAISILVPKSASAR